MMSCRFRSATLVGSMFVLAEPGVAFAQSSEPGLRTVTPKVEDAPPAPAAASVSASATTEAKGSSHVFDAYRVFADSAAAQRRAGGLSALVVGASLVATGLVTRQHWNEDFGTFLLIFGGVAAGGGAVSLVLPMEAEAIAHERGVYRTTSPSPEQEAALENEWARLASKARTARHLGAGFGFVLSAGALVSGIVVAASDGIDDDTKDWLAPTLLASGGVLAAGGVATLMMETPAETSYQAFRATQGRPSPTSSAAPSIRVGAAPLPKGGWVGLAATF